MADVEQSYTHVDDNEVDETAQIYENAQLYENAQVQDNTLEQESTEEPENLHGLENEHVPETLELEPKEVHNEDTLAVVGEKKWPGWPGESVFRMLVPAQKVGSIIGRKGEFIKKIVEETRARIKILDGPPGTAERAVSFPSSR